MQPTSVRKRNRSVLALVLSMVAIAALLAGCSTDDDGGTTSTSDPDSKPSVDIPVQFQAAEADGKAESTTWQDTCDTETGLVAIPTLNAAPCVPAFTGTPSSTSVPGVTADTIRIGYYSAKPDPQLDAVFRAAGAYDPPAQTEATFKSYVEIYSKMYETYGRKIELVKIQGTGSGSDEIAAKNDALTAKQANVFAVVGGPGQARAFQETLAANKILCIGSCTLAAPQKFYEERSPYVWPTGPSIEQSGTMLTEMVQKQLVGKNAEYAGDEAFKTQKRTFALLTYDRNDGWYADSWRTIKKQLEDAGADIVLQKNYVLDVAKIPQTAKDIAVALKQANATSVIFSGDPIMPRFFTEQATDQGYFPEWIMAGTVLADTAVFARTFDQQQWAHAFGLQLTPARVTQDQNIAYTLMEWYFGRPPESENSYAITWGNVALLFGGIQLAGENLTPETFKAGYAAIDYGDDLNQRIETTTSYGHDFWDPQFPNDVAGLDTSGVLWWDPEATGEDETGAEGKGMYRLVNGGERYMPGEWPTDPLPFFNPEGTVTIYSERPPDFQPPEYPSPPDSPAAKK
jgi:hypothetical protein